MQPFFSIITPVYNCRRYIRKCIESVLNQTYQSWELILVDDGSTDSSGEICDSYCYDSRIRVIHQNNKGELESRINGIATAEGVYILGLDADDYYDKRCLEIVKGAIEIFGSDMILFGYRNIGFQKGGSRCMLEAGKEYSQKEVLKEIIESTNHAVWNKAIKLEKVKRVKYPRIERRLDINADYVQIVLMLFEINTIYVIDDILYNYRIHKDNISQLCKVKHIFDTDIATKFVIYKLKENALFDMEIYNLIMLAYLKMIGPRLQILFNNKEISRKDCRNIHRSKIYKESKKMESLNYFNKNDFIILKLFRYRQYWILKWIVRLWKL